MKKIWALGLAVVVLLGGIFVTVLAAEAPKPAISAYGVRLSESIAIEFCATGLKAGQSYTVNFEKDGVATGKPVTIKANSSGNATIIYDKLTPAEITVKIKLSFDADGTTVTKEHSVLEYCSYQLANMSESDTLWTLIVDLLNYGAAAQVYTGDAGVAANNGLSTLQQALGTESFVEPTETVYSQKINNPTVRWTNYSVALGKSVKYRYFFTVADGVNLSDIAFSFSDGTKNWTVSGSAAKTENGTYVLDFLNLTPADLYKDITVVAKDQTGNVLSNTVTFSAARYAAYFNGEEGTALDNLLDSVLRYATSAAAYVEDPKAGIPGASLRSVTEGLLSRFEQYRLSKAPADNGGIPLYGINLINAVYARAGIDGNAFLWKLTRDPADALFPNGALTTDTGSSLYKMLIPGSYGGTTITAANKGWLAENKYRIGDLLNWYDGSTHYAGIYQGEGNFVVVNLDASVAGTTKTYAEISANKASYNWYFALRPTDLVITRGDMEDAIKEVLWAYYAKDVWAQYESGSFNAIKYTHGGYSPLGSHMQTLEDATSQSTLYSVCSNYAWCAYYEALGYPLYGYCLNPGSAYVWIMADEVAADEEGDMLCVMRWHNYPCDDVPNSTYGDFNDEDKNNDSIQHRKGVCLCTERGSGDKFDLDGAHDALVQYFTEYETNLRPGDIIRLPGHVVVYAGDGWILEAGGGKYDETYGYDSVESNGAINATTIEEYFLTNKNASFWLGKFNSGAYGKSDIKERNLAGICVLRPLNQMTLGHNENPADDILNPDYFNDGVPRLPWQLEQDTVELAHTGYTIQPGTYTRYMYPNMNINRTVNVGAYGTAEKNGTIRYSVQIINESNNANYKTTRGKDYKGETYFAVPITETIPENVEFVSASDGCYRVGNKLYWSVNVLPGETAEVTYTVKATGNIGDEIVCGGGFVGAIPSNTIVTTIGGQNLSESVEDAFLSFYEDGKDEWNSNDGYKISASIAQDGSVFAEQLYRVAGLNLDLPELEELLQMLFSREYISISQGTWVGYGKSASSWMFTLNDQTADPNDQIWRNMLINGSYFGGEYVWTNNLDKETRRVSIPRTDNLVAGDFIICMDVSNISYDAYAYKIPEWKVIFYLGNNKYASLTSDGVLSACDGPKELVGSIVWDVYIGMRPSQAYENVNEMLYSGTIDSLTYADVAWQPIKPRAVPLDSDFMNKIAGYTADTKVPYINSLGETVTRSFEIGVPMIGDVYALAGVDVNTNGLSGMTYKNLMFMLFNDLASDSEVYATYGHEYHRLEQAVYGYESINNMLMFYDGAAYVDKKPLSSMADLQEGDAIVLGRQIGKIQQVMIYQGKIGENYQFLLSTDSPIGGFYLGSELKTKTFADFNALKDYLKGEVTKGTTVVKDKYWEGYLVLRPSGGFENINTHVSRDLSQRLLTKEEMTVLSRLPATTLSDGNYNTFIKWAYSQALIDVGGRFAILNNDGNIANNMYFHQVFDSNYEKRSAETDFVKMLVDRSWGGSLFTSHNKEVYQLPLDEFQVGDIIIGRYQSGGSQYRAAIYQGNNRFLVKFSKYTRIVVCESEADIYDAQNWEYYFVLRPERLAPRDFTEKCLTNEEVQVLQSLTGATMSDSSFNTFVSWAYGQAGIDASRYFDFKADNYYFYGCFNYSNDVATLVSDSSRPAVRMLVDNSWRGSYFTNSELGEHTLPFAKYKVGDIVVGRYRTSGSVYRIAIYQGYNTFLVKHGKNVNVATYTSEEEICGNNEWEYFFVLRPDQLAPSEETTLRDLAEKALTKGEKAILATLATDYDAPINLSGFATWAYSSAEIDVSDYFSDDYDVDDVYNALFVDEKLKVDRTSNWYKMLVPGSFDGYKIDYAREAGTDTAGVGTAVQLNISDYKIGDIFCGCDAYGTFWSALYQGNGTFVILLSDGMMNVITFEEGQTVADNTWRYYFVLRPENLAVISDKIPLPLIPA